MKKILTLALLGLLQAGLAQDLTDSLKACYPLDNDVHNYATSTGSGMNATLLNNVTPANGHTGVCSTAYHFGGSVTDVIKVPGNAFTKPAAITVSGWYKASTLANHQYLVYTKNSASGCWEAYALSIWNPGTGAVFIAEKNAGGCGSHIDLRSAAISTGSWYHVVFYFDNSTAELYVNGSPVTGSPASHTVPWDYDPTPHDVFLGGSHDTGYPGAFSGDMDNVRFYNRHLSASEIAQLYADTTGCAKRAPCVTQTVVVTNTVTVPGDTVFVNNTDTIFTGCIGNYCGNAVNHLNSSYQIPMNGYNFNFTAPGNSASKVIIGNSSCGSGTARLSVNDDNLGIAIRGHCSTNSGNNIGVYGTGVDPGITSGMAAIGVLGDVNSTPNDSGHSVGVAGFSGGPAVISAIPTGVSIGVYGNSTANGGYWAGYFDGDVNVNGILSVYNVAVTSDRRFKTNIKALQGVTEKIKKLGSYTYNFKTEEFKERNFGKEEQIGFIAQELKEVFPQLVIEDHKGYMSVNYLGMIPVLLQTFKEQQQQIDELKALVQADPAAGTGKISSLRTTVPVVLSDKNIVVLNQNVPNPFAESTVITYTIPGEFTKAQIVFCTANGKIIKTTEIREKGPGSLTIFADDLSHGLYTYSLVIDGKTMDTKKMIKE